MLSLSYKDIDFSSSVYLIGLAVLGLTNSIARMMVRSILVQAIELSP